MGAERNVLKFRRGKCKVVHAGRNSAGPEAVVGAERVESSFAEHGFAECWWRTS